MIIRLGFGIFTVCAFVTFHAYACIFTSSGEIGIILRPGDKIDTELLRKNCTSDSCVFTENQVIFQSHYDSEAFVALGRPSSDTPAFEELQILSIFVMSSPVDEFDWCAAVKSELGILSSNRIISGISEEEIIAIAKSAKGGTFLYFKPENCGNANYNDSYDNSNKSGWLVGERHCIIMRYENNCPKIGCLRGGCGRFSFSRLPKSPLTFKNDNESGKTGTKSEEK